MGEVRRMRHGRWGRCAVVALALTTGCAGANASEDPAPQPAMGEVSRGGTALWGVVKRTLSGGDTTLVANATVWTEPQSDNTHTDSDGGWSITEGLAPGTYKVFVEYLGKKTTVTQVPVESGKRRRVAIVLGEAEVVWQPDFETQADSGKRPLVPAVTRKP